MTGKICFTSNMATIMFELYRIREALVKKKRGLPYHPLTPTEITVSSKTLQDIEFVVVAGSYAENYCLSYELRVAYQ